MSSRVGHETTKHHATQKYTSKDGKQVADIHSHHRNHPLHSISTSSDPRSVIVTHRR